MNDVFDVNNPPSGGNNPQVELVINGSSRGTMSVNPNVKVGEFVIEQAKAAGIRTFSAYLGDQKLTSAQAGEKLAEMVEETDFDGETVRLEIVAKDARG